MKQNVILSKINNLEKKNIELYEGIQFVDQQTLITGFKVQAILNLTRRYWYLTWIPGMFLFYMSNKKLSAEMVRLDNLRIEQFKKQEGNKNE